MLDKALSLDPGNAQIGVMLGELRLRDRQFTKAVESFDTVLRRSPTDASALTGKGLALQLQGKRGEAVNAYLLALQARHDHAGR